MPPTFSSTRIDTANTYISSHVPVPPIMLTPPTTTLENNARKLHIPTTVKGNLPAPLRAGTDAATHASQTAIDKLKGLFANLLGK